VATSWPLMHVRSRKPLQDVLTGIRVGRPDRGSRAASATAGAARRSARARSRTRTPAGALEETVRVARRCTFSLDDLKYEYPDEVVPAGYDAATCLREQTYIGARRRFPAGIPVDVQGQIEHELQLIADLKYEAYFLTVYDIVQFAREQGIL
ncbi:error-prone DNA polymerase, partial [Burkholderia cenocepacia]|nr:error-prone DNA polymerase [Burkholderia cenocepacia]